MHIIAASVYSGIGKCYATSAGVAKMMVFVALSLWTLSELIPRALANESAQERHVQQFEDWVLGGGGPGIIIKADKVTFTSERDPSSEEIALPDEFRAVVGDISALSGVPIRSVDALDPAGPSLRVVELSGYDAGTLQQKYSEKLKWVANGAELPPAVATRAFSLVGGIFSQYASGARPYYGPCIPFAHKDRETYAGNASFRVLTFFAPGMILEEPDRENRKAFCYLVSILDALGFGDTSAIPRTEFFAREVDSTSLSADLRCVIAIFYDDRIAAGMTSHEALVLVPEISRSKEACLRS